MTTARQKAREERKKIRGNPPEIKASPRPVGKPGQRSHLEREQDLETVAKLKRLGYSNSEIVIALGGKVGRQQIEKDLETIHRRHLDSMIHDRRVMAMEALEGIRHVRKEAWLAWLRSQQDAEQTVSKDGSGVDGNYTEMTVRKTGQVGNAEFLKLVHETIKRECELFGLDEPLRVDLTGGMSIDWFAMTEPTVIKVDTIEEEIKKERERGLIGMKNLSSAQNSSDKGSNDE